MSTPTIDYDALAAQSGGTAQAAPVDYDALAAQHGGTASQPPVAQQPGFLDQVSAGLHSLTDNRDDEGFLMNAGRRALGDVLSPITSGIDMARGTPAQAAATGANALAGTLGFASGQPPDLQGYAASGHPYANLAGDAAVTLPALASEIVPRAGTAIREAALGDPDAAALKGLGVSPKSPRAQQTLSAVQGARPFLQGVQGLDDLQKRIPLAQDEIWAPYKQALEDVGGNKVKGPDGTMTTVQALEDRRSELSAQLRTLKAGGPEAVALAQQKGLTQANLLREQSQVQFALDPQLRGAGIDPVGIRKAFAQVSQVGAKVAGKTTTGEANQTYGLGRLQNIDVTKPLSNFPEAANLVRDVGAGRYLNANPTDLNIREAFRAGGPKPDLTVPVRAPQQPAGLLPATTGGPFELPYYAEMDQGEKLAALMHYIRNNPRPPLALPAKAGPIITPPPNP